MPRVTRPSSTVDSDPLWYKDAIIYELHVRAFADSNGDGIGDFAGLISRLDYLQDLGITAIWLLPFYPSPLRDDGYDIASYTEVHPSYGTLRDFKDFLEAAHARGLRVITELAINHTSSEHPWFQRARRAPPGSKFRDYYVWSDSPERYQDARIIFQDFETSNWTWDPIAGAHYWHRFYSHQPDLNFDNPTVEKEVLAVLDFWMDLGVDGMRLDAVPYLFERDNTNCENLPETHAFLKRMRAHVDNKFSDRMFLAEANQWPEDASAYFGQGDECHMNFHFPLMPRMFIALQLEDSFPITDILSQTPAIPESCQWALFLRNHDELTLEMVTDEDRDSMYRTYADDPVMRVNVGIRRRLSPLLRLRKKVELLNGLLMSLPGTPVIYYGDEIGQGDNVYLGDRNGVRTPLQWSGDRNAGFSRANPQKLFLPVIIDPEYHYEAINVEAQQSNPESLLWWMKRLIAMRRQHQVFGRGSIEFLEPDNARVLAFVRVWGNDRVLVVANLSRFPQHVELDLSSYAGMRAVEMSGGCDFPRIEGPHYRLSLGSYDFYWLALKNAQPAEQAAVKAMRTVSATSFESLFTGRVHETVTRALRSHVETQRWFRSKARAISSIAFIDSLELREAPRNVALMFLRISYDSGLPEVYVLPLAFEAREAFDKAHKPETELFAARIGGRGARQQIEGVVYDPSNSAQLAELLLELFAGDVTGTNGRLIMSLGKQLRARLRPGQTALLSSATAGDQSNTTIFYGQELTLKLFRQLDDGENPDVEICQFLWDHGFKHVPEPLGSIDYDGPRLKTALAVAQRFVPNKGTAWEVTLASLERSFELALSLNHRNVEPSLPQGDLLDSATQSLPDSMAEMIGTYAPSVRLLAERTAEMHITLASDSEDASFKPEPFAGHYQRSIVQAARDRLTRVLKLLAKKAPSLSAENRALAKEVLAARARLAHRLARVQGLRVQASRIRCHGDYHLGQVLFGSNDFTILDFEGEPAQSIMVRRLKRSALYDVCGMLRSFHYVVSVALQSERMRPEDRATLSRWGEAFYRWTAALFLGSYLAKVRAQEKPAVFLPVTDAELRALLDVHMLDKCAYELAYELNNRPAWVGAPLAGLISLAADR